MDGCTLLSTRREPCVVSGGSLVSHSILQWGVTVGSEKELLAICPSRSEIMAGYCLSGSGNALLALVHWWWINSIQTHFMFDSWCINSIRTPSFLSHVWCVRWRVMLRCGTRCSWNTRQSGTRPW